MRRFRLFLVVAALAAVAWLLWPKPTDLIDSTALGSGARPTASQNLRTSSAKKSQTAVPPLEISHLADALNSPATDIREDLRLVSEILDNFRSNFPREGNPVGNNAEITAVLTGKNKLHLALVLPHHPAINADGELCDRWGTPFFFHAESSTRMEIRSAGPDKKMWSDDDVAFAP